MENNKQKSLNNKMDWYNLEDRENYDFASYIVVVETDKDRQFNMIED